MTSPLTIRSLREADIPVVCDWARREGFAPGSGDVSIYRQTDRQGLWLGWLGTEPVGCIAAVRYNAGYGFIGLFLVTAEQRGRGYGLQLWRHAMAHVHDLGCVGLEAAPDRIRDYAGWGFRPASPTTRWRRDGGGSSEDPGSPGPHCDLPAADPARSGARLPEATAASPRSPSRPWCLLEGASLPQEAVQRFDAQREPSPRPHFLRQWLRHPAGQVHALVDAQGACHGFGRIRPCLLQHGEGWRLGPVVADDPAAARALVEALLQRHPGEVLIDAPGANPQAAPLLAALGFSPVSETLRMYRGSVPQVSLADVYGLACLELG